MAYEQVAAGTAGTAYGVGEEIRTMTGEPATVHSSGAKMAEYGTMMGTVSLQLQTLGEADLAQWAVSGEAVDKLRSSIGESAQQLAVAGAIYWPVGDALQTYGGAADGQQDQLNALAVVCKQAWTDYNAAVATYKGSTDPVPGDDDYDEQVRQRQNQATAVEDAHSDWSSQSTKWNNLFVDWRTGYEHAVAALTDPDLQDVRSGDRLPPIGPPALFPSGMPSPDDVHQGQYNDCYLLATLAGIANGDPHKIMDMITANPDGTYTVHFADGDVVVSQDEVSDTDQALWARVIEGAYRKRIGFDDFNDGGWSRDVMKDIYGTGADVKDQDHGFWDFLTGGNDIADSYDDIEHALDGGKPVVADAQNGQLGFEGGGHALTVLDVYEENGKKMVVIRNPWGTNNGHEDAIRAAGGVLTQPADGTFTMSMDDFSKSFNVVEVGK